MPDPDGSLHGPVLKGSTIDFERPASFAQIESARSAETDLGISLLKTWLPTLDNRTRPDHAEMDGYGAIPLDEKFIIGGYEMDRPGDPAEPSEETICC